MWSASLYTGLDVVVAGKFKGHGTALGVGDQLLFMQLAGTLAYDSEDTLLFAENQITIYIESLGGMMVVRFHIGGQLVGFLIFGTDQSGFMVSHGTFIWT